MGADQERGNHHTHSRRRLRSDPILSMARTVSLPDIIIKPFSHSCAQVSAKWRERLFLSGTHWPCILKCSPSSVEGLVSFIWELQWKHYSLAWQRNCQHLSVMTNKDLLDQTICVLFFLKIVLHFIHNKTFLFKPHSQEQYSKLHRKHNLKIVVNMHQTSFSVFLILMVCSDVLVFTVCVQFKYPEQILLYIKSIIKVI